MSELPPIARTNYFDGEALLTADFVCEQRYHMEMLAALNRGLHIWGIATGLDVNWSHGPQSRQVQVSAGMAIDRLGREIVLTSAKVVNLRDIEAGVLYYVSIRYAEAYADLTDETNVPGYKRIVQEPKIDYTCTLSDPGLDILLAVVTVSSDGAVDALTYQGGVHERRYVGGRFGRLELLTQRSGIDDQHSRSKPVTVSAHLDDAGTYLACDAPRSRFDGALSVKGHLGIGIEHPHANLQVSSSVFQGPGYCTSNDTTLILTQPVFPPLRPGDVIVPQVPVGSERPKPAWGVIAAVTDATHLTLEKAFSKDLTQLHAYTHLRGVVAQIAAPVDDPTSSPQNLLRVDRDGTVALGMPATPSSGAGAGPAALSITRDRRVGIGLMGAPLSNARLEVNGDIQASQLSVTGDILARGTVKAQAFEGNGANLRNLPILSLWTKLDPTSNVTPIYYAAGSVCVQTKTPFGALTVGTGPAFVGNGLVTVSKDDADILIGDQTQFLDYVNPGDKIMVGALTQLEETVSQVISDTELVLEAQFPVLLLLATYQVPATGKDGAGTISGDGVRILGVGTTFTKDFKPGDLLQVTDFVPNGEDARTGRMVLNVVGNDKLVLVGLDEAPASAAEGARFVANLSAYMVQPALMGHFQDTNPLPDTPGSGNPAPGPRLNKPAMLVVSNAMNGGDVPNTVAINYELADVRPDYALMVDGPVNFSGGGHFDHLSVRDLSVTEKAIVGGTLDPASAYGLQVAGGDLRVDQSISVGATVDAQTIRATGDITAGGTLSGPALRAAGLDVNSDGSVRLFGAESYASLLAGTAATFTASTDGFVVVRIVASTDKQYGKVTCSAGGRTMIVSAVTAIWPGFMTDDQWIQFNSMTVPVKKGEVVSVLLTGNDEAGQASAAYYWIALGPPPPGAATAPATPGSLDPLPDPETFRSEPDRLIVPAARKPSAETMARLVARFTGTINAVGGRSASADVLRSLSDGVLGLTCVGRPVGAPLAVGGIDRVVGAAAQVLGATFGDMQKKTLAGDISGLLRTRCPEARMRVERLLDHLQESLATTFDDAGRRSLRSGLLGILGLDDDPDQR